MTGAVDHDEVTLENCLDHERFPWLTLAALLGPRYAGRQHEDAFWTWVASIPAEDAEPSDAPAPETPVPTAQEKTVANPRAVSRKLHAPFSGQFIES